MTTSSLKRRLDKLGSELSTFEEYLEQGNWGELYGGAETESARKKGPPYPWREGTEDSYLKKVHEQIVAIFAASEGREALISPPKRGLNEDPESLLH